MHSDMLCPGTAALCVHSQRGGEVGTCCRSDSQRSELPICHLSLSSRPTAGFWEAEILQLLSLHKNRVNNANILHQNAYFKGLQKGDMSDCHLKRVRRVMCREILDLTFDGSWWWSTSLHVWRDRHHRCLLHGLRLHLPNCLHAHSDDNDCPDPSLPSILSNVNSELRKGTESFFKISVC